MGSRFSKAVRSTVKTSPAPVKPAKTTDINHKDMAPQLPEIVSHDDITVSTSSSRTILAPRRNSEPSCPPTQPENPTANLSAEVAEPQKVAIQSPETPEIDPTPPPSIVPSTPAPPIVVPVAPPPPAVPVITPPPPAAPVITPPPPLHPSYCLICCQKLPGEKAPQYAKEVIKPCTCGSAYCTSCIKAMFLEACRDTSRMPPRCCKVIHLHHARKHLTEEEITLFKSKYEEWSTKNPFYCPAPKCSAFIPQKLLPPQNKSTGKRKDSGTGTPTTPCIFPCPSCKVEICLSCRQLAHPNSACSVNEFGIDIETAALLKSFGYKQCPKCRHGLKRMYGCNHMECRCGAHFCYNCLEDKDSCDGGCSDHEDEGVNDDDEPDEPEPLVPADSAAPLPQPTALPRNLDGGSHRYWENQDFDFGDEPDVDNIQDRAWGCYHSFRTYKRSLASALAKDIPKIECVKCWSTIHPELEASKSPHKKHETIVYIGAGARGRGLMRGRGRGRERGTYLPPRGLFRADAAVGSTTQLPDPTSFRSQSLPAHGPSPMENIQYHRVVDTYGNIISTTEAEEPRRRDSFNTSFEFLAHNAESASKKPLDDFAFTFNAPSAIFYDPNPKISLAHECLYCGLLVCESCKALEKGG